MAEKTVEHSGLPEQVLEIHEKLGFATLRLFGGLLGLRFAESFGWIAERTLLRIGLGLETVFVLLVGSYDEGSLVYDYGAGVTPNLYRLVPP